MTIKRKEKIHRSAFLLKMRAETRDAFFSSALRCKAFKQVMSELFTSFNGTSELYIECVYIRKHCNTTVYLVLDQAANITFFKAPFGGTDLFIF